MSVYTVKYAHPGCEYFAAGDSSDNFIVIEALGSLFEIGDKVFYDDVDVVNMTKKETTYAIVQSETGRQGALDFLRSIK